MTKRILVAYASRAGSTRSVAEAIAQCLKEGGAEVDLQSISAIGDLSRYQAAIIGSAIRGGKWLPEGMRFVKTNQAYLRAIPCAVFMVCMTMAMDNAQFRQGARDWMEPVRMILKPVKEGYFAGELDFKKLPASFDVLMLKASSKFGFPTGDHRDWNAIRAWGNEVGASLGLSS